MSLVVKQEPKTGTGIGPLALIDGDLIVRACAAAADGRGYEVKGEAIQFKYKEDAVSYCVENGLPEPFPIKLSFKPDPLSWALHSIDEMMLSILEILETDNYRIYLTGGKTFRHKLSPEYKANRKDQRLPYHLDDCQEYMVSKWGGLRCVYIEADDALGIHYRDGAIICTLDKDLDLISGSHYNWNTGRYFVSPIEATRNFYRQMITGDTSDNIEGLSRKHPQRRTYKTKPIDTMEEKEDMEWYVYCGYVDKFGEEEAVKQMELNGRLLWILREPVDLSDNSRLWSLGI